MYRIHFVFVFCISIFCYGGFKDSLELETVDLDLIENRTFGIAVARLDFGKLEEIRKEMESGVLIWKFNKGVSQESFAWIAQGVSDVLEESIYPLEEDSFLCALEFARASTNGSPKFDLVVSDNPQTVVVFTFDKFTVRSGVFVDGIEKLRQYNNGMIDLDASRSGALISFGSLISFLFSYSNVVEDIGIRFGSKKDLVLTSEEIKILDFLEDKFEDGQQYFSLLRAFGYDYKANGLP